MIGLLINVQVHRKEFITNNSSRCCETIVCVTRLMAIRYTRHRYFCPVLHMNTIDHRSISCWRGVGRYENGHVHCEQRRSYWSNRWRFRSRLQVVSDERCHSNLTSVAGLFHAVGVAWQTAALSMTVLGVAVLQDLWAAFQLTERTTAEYNVSSLWLRGTVIKWLLLQRIDCPLRDEMRKLWREQESIRLRH